MNYVFYKESNNSIVGIRTHEDSLDEYQITAILSSMENHLGEAIVCTTVQEVNSDDYENRYLGFDPENNVPIINPDFTPTPQPEILPEEEEAPV